MNYSKLVREAVMEVLGDGQEHSLREMQDACRKNNPEIEIKYETFNTALKRLMGRMPELKRLEKGQYRYVGDLNEDKKIKVDRTFVNLESYFNELKSIFNSIDTDMKNIKYQNLSIQEFASVKVIKEINENILRYIQKEEKRAGSLIEKISELDDITLECGK